MLKAPDLFLLRLSDSSIRIFCVNFAFGDTWNLYRLNDMIGGDFATVVSEHDQAFYDDATGIDIDTRYKYFATFNNAPIETFINVIQEAPNEDPPFVEFDVIAPTTATMDTVNIEIPWGADLVDVPIIVLENFSLEWEESQPRTILGNNQII